MSLVEKQEWMRRRQRRGSGHGRGWHGYEGLGVGASSIEVKPWAGGAVLTPKDATRRKPRKRARPSV